MIEAEDQALLMNFEHPIVEKRHPHNKTADNSTVSNITEPVEPEIVWPAECSAPEEALQRTDRKTFDSSLHFHTDYTRSVVAQIGDDPIPFHLIPDTSMS